MKIVCYAVDEEKVTELLELSSLKKEGFKYLVEVLSGEGSYLLFSVIHPDDFQFSASKERKNVLLDSRDIVPADASYSPFVEDAKKHYHASVPLAKEALLSIRHTTQTVKVLLKGRLGERKLSKPINIVECVRHYTHSLVSCRDLATTFLEEQWDIDTLFHSSYMQDKQRQEIFSGDIVSIDGFGIGYVLYHEGRWAVVSSESIVPLRDYLKQTLVIGDIIHSPALLSKGRVA
jgi:hypothetical protein